MGVFCINVRNVNEALPAGLRWLTNMNGMTEASRNGPVRVSPTPVVTTYDRPCERVLFGPMRDANPFFHLFESLWMLAGRNDVWYPTIFNQRFDSYSDDGEVFHGAYGHRWRHALGIDQITAIIALLKDDPSTRRAVLQMWDATSKLESDGPLGFVWGMNDLIVANDGKDVPCNTTAYFRVNAGRLDLTVLCRSNDILWGAYGANAVHFSMLLEYVAAHVGVPVGKMFQFSNNFHYYTDVVGDWQRAMDMAKDTESYDLYQTKKLAPYSMINDPTAWDIDLAYFFKDPTTPQTARGAFYEPFFKFVVGPMNEAWLLHKAKEYQSAVRVAHTIEADDWRTACVMWLERRALKHREKHGG